MGKLVFNYSAGVEESFSALNSKVTTLDDGSGASSVTILTQPENGRAIARSDGLITLDLTDQTSLTPRTFTYNRTVSGVTTPVEATVTVTAPFFRAGVHAPRFYRPEINGTTDALVIEMGETSRVVMVKQDGLTAADIANMESMPGGSGVSEGTVQNITWLITHQAMNGNLDGAYYGETYDLALDWKTLGRGLFKQLRNTNYTSPWLLLERGMSTDVGFWDSVNASVVTTFESIGESPLHPVRVEAYGTGDLPHFEGKGARIFRATNIAVSDLSFEEAGSINSWNSNFCVDNMYANMSAIGLEGGSGLTPDGDGNGNAAVRHCSVRRCIGIDNFLKTPSSSVWDTGDRVSFAHPARVGYYMFEKMWVEQSGASIEYRADRSIAYPKAPENQSHGIYQSIMEWGANFQDILFTWPSGSIMQLRSGGNVQDMVGMGYNTGINPAVGPLDNDNAFGITDGGGDYTTIHRFFMSSAGFKSWWDGRPGPYAGGLSAQTYNLSLIESGAINGGTYRTYNGPTDEGPGVDLNHTASANIPENYWPIKIDNAPEGSTPISRGEWSVSGYNRDDFPDGLYEDGENRSDLLAGAASEATRDAATIGAFTDTLLGTTGSDLLTFSTYLRTLKNSDEPWQYAKQLADYWGNVLGYFIPTPVPGETVTFQPNAGGWTPGHSAHMKIDWDKRYLPGDTTNNDVDLDGHRVYWNYTPKNAIRNFTFGEGGSLELLGGALKPSGSVIVPTGGASILMERGSKFHLPAYSSSNALTVDAMESRFVFAAACTGNVSATARYGSELVSYGNVNVTVPSGASWTVYGYGKAGFDGKSGTPTLTFSSGSTLNFKPSCRLNINGMTNLRTALSDSDNDMTDVYNANIGATILGVTSEATAVVRARIQTGATAFTYIIDDIIGTFINGEDIQCDDNLWGPFELSGTRTLGQVNGTPTLTMGAIREVSTGLNGWDGDVYRVAPTNVTSTVVLSSGMTVNVDADDLAPGPYTLIDVDSLTDNGATLPSGVSVVDNTLVLTVS